MSENCEVKEVTPKVELDTDELLNGALTQINGILDNIKERSTQEEKGKLNINLKINTGSVYHIQYVFEVIDDIIENYPTENINLDVYENQKTDN